VRGSQAIARLLEVLAWSIRGRSWHSAQLCDVLLVLIYLRLTKLPRNVRIALRFHDPWHKVTPFCIINVVSQCSLPTSYLTFLKHFIYLVFST
jgi:hypothetical protein